MSIKERDDQRRKEERCLDCRFILYTQFRRYCRKQIKLRIFFLDVACDQFKEKVKA